MAKYLLLKHYRGAPDAVNDVPMDQWTPEEVEDHMQYMNDFAARLEGTGEFVDSQALSPEGTFVRYDGEGRPPVTDGPFAETKDLIAGWMVIDVDTYERALAARRRVVGGTRVPAASRSTSGSSCVRSWAKRRRSPSDRSAGSDPVMDELLLRELTPAVIGVLVRRGVDFATAEDAVQEALRPGHA